MIYIGADHGGFQLKEKIKTWLASQGQKVEDVGPHELNPHDDYPVFGVAVAKGVAQDNDTTPWANRAKGILICRSSAGVVITANKVKGIRAVSVVDERGAIHSRQHNNANVIGISGDWTDENSARVIIKAWLGTDFGGEERHVRRLAQIAEIENHG